MPRRDCRKDANHDQIAVVFRQLGCMVIETWQFAQYIPGYPDLDVRWGKASTLVEVKAGAGKQTADELAFEELCNSYRVPYTVIRTERQAELLALAMRKGA